MSSSGEAADDGVDVVASESLTLRVARISQRIQRRLAPRLAEAGLTYDHWRLIAALGPRPGSPMSVLADLGALPAPTVSRYVDRLVQRGLVLRRMDPNDRRKVVTALTEAGQVLFESLRAIERDIETELYAVGNRAVPLPVA